MTVGARREIIHVNKDTQSYLTDTPVFGFLYISGSILLKKEGRKEVFDLTMHSIHFIYGYMASDIW